MNLSSIAAVSPLLLVWACSSHSPVPEASSPLAQHTAARGGANAIYLQSEGVSSEGGWAVTAGDKQFSPQAPGGTETLLHGIVSPVRMFALEEFPTPGNKLVSKGRTLINSKPYDEFDAVYVDGSTAEILIDPTTPLIAKIREHKPMHLAIDPRKLTIETQFSDYRPVPA